MDGVVDQQHGIVGKGNNMGACAGFGGVYCIAIDNILVALAELVGAEYNGA